MSGKRRPSNVGPKETRNAVLMVECGVIELHFFILFLFN